MSYDNKLVIVVNKDIDIGIAMNAVAHASLALGAILNKDTLLLQDYKDASHNIWPISEMPYIILKGKSNEIRKTIVAAKEANILQIAFTETMTGGTSVEQIERTSKVNQDDHIFYAGVLFGPWDVVSLMTKKLSLYK